MISKAQEFKAKPYRSFLILICLSSFLAASCSKQPDDTAKKGNLDAKPSGILNENSPSIRGMVTIKGQHFYEVSEITEGKSGYSNLVGAQIVVKNSSGKIIGVGKLSDFKIVEQNPGNKDVLAKLDITQTFSIESLPKEDFYEIVIGSRSPLTYSIAELESSGWNLDLSIGD